MQTPIPARSNLGQRCSARLLETVSLEANNLTLAFLLYVFVGYRKSRDFQGVRSCLIAENNVSTRYGCNPDDLASFNSHCSDSARMLQETVCFSAIFVMYAAQHAGSS
jgi:hypothetical protein